MFSVLYMLLYYHYYYYMLQNVKISTMVTDAFHHVDVTKPPLSSVTTLTAHVCASQAGRVRIVLLTRMNADLMSVLRMLSVSIL